MTATFSDAPGLAQAAEAPRSAVSWGAIFAGAAVAAAVSLALMILGAGFGLTIVSSWSNSGVSAGTFAVTTAIGLVVIQWIASGLGGYITGRLRTRWVGIHTDEKVFFHDTAHGFLAWSARCRLPTRATGPDRGKPEGLSQADAEKRVDDVTRGSTPRAKARKAADAAARPACNGLHRLPVAAGRRLHRCRQCRARGGLRDDLKVR